MATPTSVASLGFKRDRILFFMQKVHCPLWCVLQRMRDEVMDIQKERKAFEEFYKSNFSEMDLSHANQLRCINGRYVLDKARWLWGSWQAAKAQAVPDGFALVPKADVHDHYVAEHLKGTTCSVDVSELTGSAGDRVYGKLRPYDCIGSDGNTLLYDLESSNFNMQRHTGNSGDYVLVPKDPTKEMVEAGVFAVLSKGGVYSVYKAMIEAAEVK